MADAEHIRGIKEFNAQKISRRKWRIRRFPNICLGWWPSNIKHFSLHTDTCRRERERERERDRDVRSPQSQIVSEKLHDQGTVLVGLLTQCIQLRYSLIKSLPNVSKGGREWASKREKRENNGILSTLQPSSRFNTYLMSRFRKRERTMAYYQPCNLVVDLILFRFNTYFMSRFRQDFSQINQKLYKWNST